MNTALSSDMRSSGSASSAVNELRQEGEEEDRKLGIQNVDQDRLDDHLHCRLRLDVLLDFEGAVVTFSVIQAM